MKTLYIVGYNEDNLKIYKSASEDEAYILADLSKDDEAALYKEGIRFISAARPEYVIADALTKEDGCISVIINTKSSDKNCEIAKSICAEVRKITDSFPDKDRVGLVTKLVTRFKAFVFGDAECTEELIGYENESLGTIRCVNPEERIALDFIDRYPIAKFIPRDKILPDTTVSPSLNINVFLLGFDVLGARLLSASVANNQFLTRIDGGLAAKQVKYTVFDHGISNEIKDTLPMFRYERELVRFDKNGGIKQSSRHLPLPPCPAIVDFVDDDCSNNPIEMAREICKRENELLFVIINHPNSFTGLRTYRAICNIINEVHPSSDIFLFLREHRDGSAEKFPLAYSYGESTLLGTAEGICSDRTFAMALERNRIYTLESEYLVDIADGHFDGSFDDIIDAADYKWYAKRTHSDRESNIYAVLSIRSKLNLLGLDYEAEPEAPINAEIYDAVYTKGEIKYIDGLDIRGRKIPAALTYTFTDTTRGVLAHQEHLRWNSFMICGGFIPATIRNILKEKNKDGAYTNGKNTKKRLHGNITTEAGLIEYRRIVAGRDKCDELSRDVICYDYQLMDDAVWLILSGGYKLKRLKED